MCFARTAALQGGDERQKVKASRAFVQHLKHNVQKCPKTISGRAKTGPRGIQDRSRQAPDRSRAAKIAQWRPQGASETLQKRLGRLPRRPLALFASPIAVGSVCGSIFERFRPPRGRSEVRFVSLLPMFYRCRTFCASNACGTQKLRKKKPFRPPKSRPGISWRPSGEQVRAPKRPSRAKKRVRSASGASENSKVGANEPSSSEKARPESAKSARAPRPPSAFSVISCILLRT